MQNVQLKARPTRNAKDAMEHVRIHFHLVLLSVYLAAAVTITPWCMKADASLLMSVLVSDVHRITLCSDNTVTHCSHILFGKSTSCLYFVCQIIFSTSLRATHAACPIKGQKYSECKGCDGTCEEPFVPCPAVCRPGCSCPPDTVVHEGLCIPLDDCPPLSEW